MTEIVLGDQVHSRTQGLGLYRLPRNTTHPLDIGLGMHVFTFRSRTYPGITGFTTWRSGANLPEETGPWVLVGQGAMHAGGPVTGIRGGADAVLAGIDRDGFYLGSVDFGARRST
jgi:hypothetical protein